MERHLFDLQDEPYVFSTDTTDLRALKEYLPKIKDKDITGAVVAIQDGDYVEIWITMSSRPYAIDSLYTRVY